MFKRCLSALCLASLPLAGLYQLDAQNRLLILTLYLLASLIAFIQYAWDKRAAIAKRPRISEKILHLTALLGGWPGAWLGRILLRHKTLKQPFVMHFFLIVGLHQFAWLLWLWHKEALSLGALLSYAKDVVRLYV